MTIQEIINSLSLRYNAGQISTTYQPTDAQRKLVVENKPAIIAHFEAEIKAKKEFAAKVKSIEGINEIETVITEWDRYEYAVQRMMERGGITPRQPQTKIEDVKAKYPRAAAYLTARTWASTSNYGKSQAGEKAMNAIVNGDDYIQAIETMKNEFSAYASANID